MIIYPAIDIRGGKAVRLVEGDYDRETVFDADPLDAALRWQAEGAEWIHIVDLDGARDGVRANAETILRIRKEINVPIQLGGGLRTIEDIDAMIAAGINRVVIGSAAVTNPVMVEFAVKKYGERIAVGLDARDGRLATQGWTEQTRVTAIHAGITFAAMGVQNIIYTDIGRDGKLEGPNIAGLIDMTMSIDANVIASGGVSSIADIRSIKRTRAAGVIVGAALYHERISLAEAITAGAAS
ncbi:MAG: 1-(5-phosphoribosyl)-5-[(5-phosphoribosylamino)methylideneamino]imidazole-4-carboxamide isomerase [Thermomicrobiales bacterium]|nr:1-(5-phosphoribosyl)-5-[(5-phosphoribosylamino)methylideneamino]imidazole-4-carboxamide isomerase [Thermomicrobiales bacterium]